MEMSGQLHAELLQHSRESTVPSEYWAGWVSAGSGHFGGGKYLMLGVKFFFAYPEVQSPYRLRYPVLQYAFSYILLICNKYSNVRCTKQGETFIEWNVEKRNNRCRKQGETCIERNVEKRNNRYRKQGETCIERNVEKKIIQKIG